MTDPIPLHPQQHPHGQSGSAPPEGPAPASQRERRKIDNVISVVFGVGDEAVNSRRMKASEREFLPAALEVIETPVSPTLRATAFAICSLAAITVLWCCLAHIDMVAVASGKVIPLGQIKVVQALETSAIRAIHVDDGDHVAAGQLLVELDPTDAKADLDSLLYDQGQAALDAEVGRLLLTRDASAPFHAPPNVDEALADANHEQARNEIAKHNAQIAGINSDIAQRQALIEASEAQVERARTTIPLLEEKHATAEVLYDKRFGGRPAVLDSQQSIIEKQAELKAAQAAIRQTRAEMDSLKHKLEETSAGFLADATDRRTKALQKLAALTQQIAKARQRESYRRLTAPVDGTVQNVKIHTPGAVVTTADTLMTVVPDGAGVEVEAMVENKDIGFVREGQDVEVKFDAFPFTRYGLIKGTLRKISHDAATTGPQGASAPASTSPGATPPAANAGAADLAYATKISLARDWIMADGRRDSIQPGMRVAAEIKTGDRRVIEFLLSPVMQAVTEAGRER